MIAILSAFLTLAAVVAALLAGFLLAEVVAGLLRRERQHPGAANPGLSPVVVVIPAHDEEAAIRATIANIAGQLGPGDRILVVADNCTDGTASVAREEGVDVVERHDPARRGKGYALQFGLDALRAAPPGAVIFFDADCRFEPGSLDRLKAAAEETGTPVQALYLMDPAPGRDSEGEVDPKQALAAFAWTFINRTRMRGLMAIGGLTRITGSGVLLPWATAASLDLASGQIVEDLAMTIALARRREGPRLVEAAVVRSVFPSDDAAAARQHARWEHGSLGLLRNAAIPLLAEGLKTGNRQAAALGLDVAIPPLTLFGALIAGLVSAASALALLGHGGSFAYASTALVGFTLATAIGWLADGREVAPWRAVKRLPAYVLGKFGVYGREARASTKTWTRTDRDPAP